MSPDREILTIGDEYTLGDLSRFPEELDLSDDLYETSDNAICVLRGKLGVDSDIIHVNDNGFFPDKGIIRINDELIYYRTKETNTFSNLIRGFNNTSVMNHSTGSVILGCVSSLHHNSLRDAIIKTQQKTGLLSDDPDINGTLSSRVKYLDIKWFTPVSKFYALPRNGRYPLKVNFQSYALGDPYIDFEWDFGDSESPSVNPDGSSNSPISSEKNPTHTFYKPGQYTVTLTVTSYDGRRSFLKKQNYINVFDDDSVYNVFAYARHPAGVENEFEILKLNSYGSPDYDNRLPFTVQFVDQTLGEIKGRRWNFGDGNIVELETNSYDHIINHTYTEEGAFWPQLQVLDKNNTLRTFTFRQPIICGINYAISNEELLKGPSSISDLTKPIFTQNNNMQNIDNQTLNESLIIG